MGIPGMGMPSLQNGCSRRIPMRRGQPCAVARRNPGMGMPGIGIPGLQNSCSRRIPR
jgi:hypothetical protein